MLASRFFSIVGRVLPDTVRCELVPVDSVLPSRVVISSEVMAALLYLATTAPEESVTPIRLVEILREMELLPRVFHG